MPLQSSQVGCCCFFQVREQDIETLNTVTDVIVFGDIKAEDLHTLSERQFVKLFRLAQLIGEYLLYI